MNRRALIPRGGGRTRRSGWLVAKADSNWTVDAHDRSIHKLRVSASQLTANQIARASRGFRVAGRPPICSVNTARADPPGRQPRCPKAGR